MLTGAELGVALFLAGVLVTAGAAKLLAVELTRTSLGRLLGAGRRAGRRSLGTAAVVLGVGEVGLGLALPATPLHGVPATAAPPVFAAVLCLGFVLAVRRARRLGAACGCFGSLSLRVSGPVESARAAALLGLAALLVLLRLVKAGPGNGSAAGFAVGLAAGLLLAAAATVVPMAVAGNARTAGQLRAMLLPPRTGWRPAGLLARYRILRAVRDLADVRDVERYLGRPVPWRRAHIRVTGRGVLASVMVVDGDVRMHVVLPRRGPVAVLGMTPAGVVTPARARGDGVRPRAGAGKRPGPPIPASTWPTAHAAVPASEAGLS